MEASRSPDSALTPSPARSPTYVTRSPSATHPREILDKAEAILSSELRRATDVARVDSTYDLSRLRPHLRAKIAALGRAQFGNPPSTSESDYVIVGDGIHQPVEFVHPTQVQSFQEDILAIRLAPKPNSSFSPAAPLSIARLNPSVAAFIPASLAPPVREASVLVASATHIGEDAADFFSVGAPTVTKPSALRATAVRFEAAEEAANGEASGRPQIFDPPVSPPQSDRCEAFKASYSRRSSSKVSTGRTPDPLTRPVEQFPSRPVSGRHGVLQHLWEEIVELRRSLTRAIDAPVIEVQCMSPRSTPTYLNVTPPTLVDDVVGGSPEENRSCADSLENISVSRMIRADGKGKGKERQIVGWSEYDRIPAVSAAEVARLMRKRSHRLFCPVSNGEVAVNRAVPWPVQKQCNCVATGSAALTNRAAAAGPSSSVKRLEDQNRISHLRFCGPTSRASSSIPLETGNCSHQDLLPGSEHVIGGFPRLATPVWAHFGSWIRGWEGRIGGYE